MAGVHKRFKKNKDVILKTLKDLENDHDPTWFCFVKLINCNATNGEKFSNAWCHTDRNIYADEEDLRSIVPFSHLFNFDIARSFMENEHRPEGSVLEAQLVAFERLSSFLENIEEISKLLQRVKENQNDVSESSLAAVLGIHVLKKLSVSQQMIFDTGYRDIKPQQCPCGKCDESILSGDNSIGHSDVWHGSVDIILRDTACSIKKLNDIDPPDSEIEMKRHYDFELFRSQFIAETITFAFLIKARLTPFLCLSCEKVKIFMYDKVSDLLYEGFEMPLFAFKNQLRLTTIIAVWFVVNYTEFCTGVKSSHKELGYTADFRKIVNIDVLYLYENKLHRGGCRHVRRKMETMNFDNIAQGRFEILKPE